MAALLSAGLISPAEGRESESPAAFLRRIYAPYVAGDTTADPTGTAAPTIFDARLTALIRQDQVQLPGEIGMLDQNPICDCQDFDRLKLLSIKIYRRGVSRTTADVRFINGDTTSKLTYTLTWSRRGWRVTDIRTPDMPSLVGFLQAGMKHETAMIAGSTPTWHPPHLPPMLDRKRLMLRCIWRGMKAMKLCGSRAQITLGVQWDRPPWWLAPQRLGWCRAGERGTGCGETGCGLERYR